MNLLELVRTGGDRHFTSAERALLRAGADRLNLAARVSASVEESESAVVHDVIAALRDRYPRFGQLQPQAWERLAADLQLVLRHDVRALALGEPQSLDESVLDYLRSVFGAYRLSNEFVRECFSLLRQQLYDRLKPDELAAIGPYLDRNVEVLASGPEPAAAVV